MIKRSKALCSVLMGFALMFGLAGTASAALVATDLNSGGTDAGFNGGWVGSSNIRITSPGDLAYANYFITQSGTPGSVYSANTASTDRMDSRNLTSAMSGEIWFTALVNVPAADNFAGLSFDSNATTAAPDQYSHALSELRVLLTPSALTVDMTHGAPTATGTETGTFSAGTTHLVLGYLNLVTGNDTISIWIDPDLSAVSAPGDLPTTTNFTSTTVDFMDSLARIGVPISDGGGNDTAHVDAIWISDTASAFEDVTGVTGADTTAPGIAVLSPANTETNISVATDLVISFDEDVAKSTNGNIVIQQSAGGIFETIAVTSDVVTVSASNVTINPSTDLAAETGYYIEIDAGAITDVAAASNAFAGISGAGTWSFTTEVADVSAPVLVALSPTNGATGVTASSDLVISFDEDVQKGSGDIVIRESGGGIFETIAVGAAAVTISASNVTINPSSNMDGGSNYYVEIDSGAIEDLAGNGYTGFSGSGTWAFQIKTGALVATDLNTGGTDTGFSGGWAGSSGVGITTAADLTYANYGITQSGTTARVYNHYPDNSDRQDERALAAAMDGEIWFSALVNVPAGGAFVGLSFNNNSGNAYSHVNSDLRVLMTPTQLQVSFDGGAMMAGSNTLAAGTTHLILGQMNIVTGNDTLTVWVDPDLSSVSGPGDLPAAEFKSTSVDFADSIVELGVPGDDNGAVTLSIDALWLSDRSSAFQDVTGTSGPDTTAPMLAGLSPANGATNVSVGTDLVISFDEDVAKGTNGNIVIQQSAGGTFETIAVTSANVTVSDTNVTINPSGSLVGLTGYYVEIDNAAIEDLSGNVYAGFSGAGTWSFTTAVFDVTAPSLVSLSPTNGASGIAVDADLVIQFSEDVAKGTNGNIVIQQSAGGIFETIAVTSANVSVSSTSVTISASSDFTKGVGYYVEIDDGAIKDLTGNAYTGFTGSATWSFDVYAGTFAAADLNTGGTDTGFSGGWLGSSGVLPVNTNDLVYGAYAITQSGSPEYVYSGSSGHVDRQDSRSLAATMSGEIWFSALVNVPATDTLAGLSFHSSTPSQPYQHSESDVRVLLTPTQLLVDLDGGSPATATGTESGSFTAGETHLLLGMMDVGAGTDSISVWVDPDLSAVSGPGDLPTTTNFVSTAVDFTDQLTIIGVPIQGSGMQIDAIRLSDRSSGFLDVTGLGVVESIPPTIAALSPTHSATAVEIETDLVITFSEPVKKGSGNIVIQQTAGGTFETIPVGSASVTLLGGGAVSINPSVNFAGNTGYHVEIDAGAFTDFAATPNAFAGFSGSGTWAFTTENVDVTPPAIAVLSPANGATGVSLDTDLVISFDEDVQKGATGDITIQQSAGGTFETIAVTSPNVTISGSNVTINPAGLLAKGTGYYVEIDNGAIRDLAPSPNDFAGISGAATWGFNVSSGALVEADLNLGGAESGFSGAWGGSGFSTIIDASDLTYPNYFITQTGTTERVYRSTANNADRQASRVLAKAMADEIWFSVLVNVPAGGEFAGISFDDSSTVSAFHAGAALRVLLTPTELLVDLDGGTPPTATGTETGTFAADATHLLLGKMDVVSGNDTIEVWVDPNIYGLEGPEGLPAANFSSTSVDFADLITLVGVPGYKGSATEVYTDAIRVSDRVGAFVDVVGLPPRGTMFVLR